MANATLERVKSALESRTVWANLVGLAALALSFIGIDLAEADQQALIEAILQIVAGGAFVASTIFRVIATRRIA